MSQFAVTLERIAELRPHPAADRLVLARVEGNTYQFCVRKDEYQVGDTVLYFPVDSILPTWIVDRLGIRNFMGGKHQNRVHTTELRGQPSQGLVCRPSVLVRDGKDPPGMWTDQDLDNVFTGAVTDLTAFLGVTKWEPPEVEIENGTLLPLPDGLRTYDIENSEAFASVVDMLMDVPVLITEKVEGTNFAVVCLEDGKVVVCQRSGQIVEVEGAKANPQWELARQEDWLNRTQDLWEDFGRPKLLAIRGELLGPGCREGNYYGLPQMTMMAFDIKVDHRYIDAAAFLQNLPGVDLHVPVLSRDRTLRQWLNGQTLAEASNGPSFLNPTKLREGIVIKPMVEQTVDFGIGDPCRRLILKQRSPRYLAKQG